MVSWSAPLYNGGLEQLGYRLLEMRTDREWIAHGGTTSLEVLTNVFSNFVFSVEVVDLTNSTVSERSDEFNGNSGFNICQQDKGVFRMHVNIATVWHKNFSDLNYNMQMACDKNVSFLSKIDFHQRKYVATQEIVLDHQTFQVILFCI